MKYPIGIQTLSEIINNGYVYVDKTEYVYKMISTSKYFFLSRPRRFGKSLFVSTLEEYFSGNRELFKGLAIEKLEEKWESYPVFHLDLSSRNYEKESALEAELNVHLEQWEELYGDEKKNRAVEERFRYVIQKAYEKTGKQVVILIDEYDKPLLHNIDNKEQFDKTRNALKAFYSVLKSQDRYIRFGFLTGVTRFGKVSVFSDLNNLNDISESPDYSGLCGITEVEMLATFDSSIRELAEYHNVTFEEMCQQLRKNYDGYHFAPNSVGVYNPFSLVKVFGSKQLDYFWYETGTPTFLVEILKKRALPVSDLEGITLKKNQMVQSIDSIEENVIPVLYQSGYLTIKDYNEKDREYTLGAPNLEVEWGFTENLAKVFAPKLMATTSFGISQFTTDIRNGAPESFMERFQGFFADSSYELAGDKELYFQNTTYVLFKLLGLYVEVERHTSRGRMDVTVCTKDYVYIIELKVDKSADEALQQIEEKQYALPFAKDSRKLFKIGINFDSATRTIGEWKIV